ncbi:mitochondrial carrier domain-containing protein [Lipomyces oligophaga]|uniref:mitochondrial carrier domain-containing protein n=1 Tax=Lipomyces oligophaga TaxID=45792 RepID=UPI0034CFB596
MSAPWADFIAGYVSGVVSIAIGNPLDIIKVQAQNAISGAEEGTILLSTEAREVSTLGTRLRSLLHGVAAPVIGYGALNALLFSSYSISLRAIDPYVSPVLASFTAGTVAGLSTFVISAPIENVKCLAQISHGAHEAELSSLGAANTLYRNYGISGFFRGGLVTGLRDGFGYGVYFWAYDYAKTCLGINGSEQDSTLKLLLAGGLAGCATWASIFPLDVVKTRYQAQSFTSADHIAEQPIVRYSSAWDCAVKSYRSEGIRVFFRGLSVCLVRAFIVNAVQFGTYEWMMDILVPTRGGRGDVRAAVLEG